MDVDRPILFLDVDGPLIPFGPSWTPRESSGSVSDSEAGPDEGNPCSNGSTPPWARD